MRSIDFGVEIIGVILGIFYIVLGSGMTRVKRNAFWGIRTKWSMYNDETWAESNRFGGKGLVVIGILTVLGALLVGGMISIAITCGLFLLYVIVTVFYSYKIYKKVVD